MTFESGVPEDGRSAMIVSLYKGKGERTESENYRGISLLSMMGKVYSDILVHRVCGVTEVIMSKGFSDQGRIV